MTEGTGVSKSGVIAIVPLHNPDDSVRERLIVLASQVDGMVIVDDGSAVPFEPIFDDGGLAVFLRQDNRGIAAAINAGAKAALDRWPATNFLLTMDQDSTLGAVYVSSALATYASAVKAGLPVVGVSAERFNAWTVKSEDAGAGFRSTLQVAQSGLMMPMSAWRRFGPLREDLFIDAVDTDFALRCKRAGGLVLAGQGCSLLHEVGSTTPIRILGRRVKLGGRERSLSYHSSLRRYYITRNRCLVYPKYARTAPAWLLRDTLAEMRTFGLSLLFGPDKPGQVLAFVLGVVDGAKRRSGPASQVRVRQLASRRTRASGDS